MRAYPWGYLHLPSNLRAFGQEELRGEEDPLPDYPPLQGRDNYPSAKEFTDEINATFEEEKNMGIVRGTLHPTRGS